MLFNQMRVDTDKQSAESARALNAKADSAGHQGDEKRGLRPISQLSEGLYGKIQEGEAGQAATSLPRSGHDFRQIRIHPPAAGPIQTKLTINHPGDEYEREADRVADRVVCVTAPQLQRKCACGGACPECQAEQSEEEDIRLQTKNVGSGHLGQTTAPPIVHDILRSPGQPLDPGTRAFFEPSFGHGFGHVRVHANARAADSAQAVNALAYTVGRHVVFGQGQYQPHTPTGAKLIAHELTHVIQQSGARESGAGQSTNERCLVPSRRPTTVVIARQAAPGWSDAPANDHNREVTTVDATGKITTGQVRTTQGVWHVPLEGLHHGLQTGDKGPAFESPKGRAVVLIPNTVKAVAADKGPVRVDVLLHLHGFGVGYRQLQPRQRDFAKVLKEGELRDVHLYEMEQQLLSLVTARQQLMIAVLPQGSERSDFGDLGSKSDDYLKEVFAKLTTTFLPANASPGRVILSGHSGGGPTAMKIARERKLKDVLLFDAINWSCFDEHGDKTECNKSGVKCKSNEFDTVAAWVKERIKADTGSLTGKDDEKVDQLKRSGTRFRGVTSQSFTTKEEECASYGFWYKKLDDHIKNEIKKLNLSKAVEDQLEKNYTVKAERGQHERVIGGQRLEDALKD